MSRLIVALLVCLAVVSSLAAAQPRPAATEPRAAAASAGGPAQAAKTATSVPDRETLEKVLNGWASLNPDNVVRYYDQQGTLAFYDISPLKYEGFEAYRAGSKEFLSTLASLKFTLNPDAAVHSAGTNWAFSMATVHMRMEDKAGKTSELDGRWTAVWQRKAGKWLIVHDHFSAPLPMGPPEK